MTTVYKGNSEYILDFGDKKIELNEKEIEEIGKFFINNNEELKLLFREMNQIMQEIEDFLL